MKALIIAIVGPSGSGKTTLAQHIEQTLGIPTLVSYTTRPKRPGETDGVEHYFVEESAVPPLSETLAYTYFGKQHYWVELKQIVGQQYTYVIDEAGLLDLLENHSHHYDILAVKINCPYEQLASRVDEKRLKRDLERPTLDSSIYDAIIENDSSFDEFIEKGTQTIKNLIGYDKQ